MTRRGASPAAGKSHTAVEAFLDLVARLIAQKHLAASRSTEAIEPPQLAKATEGKSSTVVPSKQSPKTAQGKKPNSEPRSRRRSP